jgi:hypothetical protein
VLLSIQSCRRSRHCGRGWRYIYGYIYVVVDGFAHDGVWVIIIVSIVQVLPDGWKIYFPMELSVSDEPSRAVARMFTQGGHTSWTGGHRDILK